MFITKKEFERKINEAISQDREQIDMFRKYYDLATKLEELEIKIDQLEHKVDKIYSPVITYTIHGKNDTVTLNNDVEDADYVVARDEF